MEANPVRPGRVRHGGDGPYHLWPLLPATILDPNPGQNSLSPSLTIDLSQLSRDIIEKVDATSTLSVAVRAPTLAAARQSLDRGEVFAVLGVPPGTQRDVLKGNRVSVPVYVDATYLFIFRSTASSIAAAIGSVSSDLATRGVARGRTQHD